MLEIEAKATGRRRITAAMLAAQVARPSYWDATRKGTVLAALKRAADPLGIARRVVELIDTLMAHTHAADWSRGCGVVPCWPSNAVLQDAMGIGSSQLKTLIRLALELGLIEVHDSPTGKRYGHRDAEGRCTRFFGFDLSPLARRLPEFQRVAADRKAAWQQGQRLREDVSALRNKVLALADAGREQCAAGDWQRIEDDARQLAASRGTSREPGHLARIVAELDEIYQGALEALTPCETVDSDPVGPKNRPLHTTTNQLPIAKANTVEDGPSRPDAVMKPESRREDFTRKTVSPGLKGQMGERERRADNALRGFDVSPEFVVKIAPIFAPWIGNIRPTWNVLLDASTYVRSELGVSQHAWGQACEVLGRIEAIVLLATIAARHEAGAIGSPGGVMRRMVELHQEGKLRLDRTLFGLADRLKGRVH